MPPRKRLKTSNDQPEEGRCVPRNTTSPARSPNVQIASPTTGPALQPPTSIIPPRCIPSHVSAPPSSKTTRLDQDWACLKDFLRVLDKCAAVFGPLKVAMGDLVECIDIYEDATAARTDYMELKLQLEALFSELSTHFSANAPGIMTASMENLCSTIESELDSISSKEQEGTPRRHLGAMKDSTYVTECYRRVHRHLERLTLNADLNTWKIVDEQMTETRLKSLTPSMSACYNSAEAALVRRRECTPKTREQVLADLSHWRHDQNQGPMYWLNGMAGTGKTTIANSLCAMLDLAHELGASFFCTRQLPECRNVKLIIPTVAYQLARFSRPFRCALSRVLEHNPDVHTRALSNQLHGLVITPLREVAHTLPTNLVVVIDALDECDESDGVGQILEMFARHTSGLPIKVFVSSRPEPQIRDRIGDMKPQLILHELDKSVVKEDIEIYLRAELARMSLSESQLAALVERSGILFIYAATVVRYIGEDNFSLNPGRRLANVLEALAPQSSNKNQEIDELYTLVLSSALDNPKLEDEDKAKMKLVLHTVICAQEPLTIDAVARLLQLDDVDQVYCALRRLWSVVHISEENRLVTTLHESFPDYMLDSSRSKRYSCDSEKHHGELAELSFERIKRNKRQFNICELESSYLFDEEVDELDEMMEEAIPLDLMYACQYWAVHLELGGGSNKRVQLLDEFLSTRLLLWMEVLNLKKRMNTGVILLEKARRWCTKAEGPQGLKRLTHDAWRFVTMFAANPVSRSTPHIYVSMLAFWPSSSSLAGYVKRASGLVEAGGSGMAKRQLALLSIFEVDGIAWSVAFSPDGTRISGSQDERIFVWDAQNGQMVLDPLEGHTGSVYSLSFSPDTTRIVSGSYDKTICMWDARSGQMILGPLEGHTGPVNSVAFSPDGMLIVSGSDDKTIRMWDARNGHAVLGPLIGHADTVRSVAFLPDGTQAISGSDEAICLWDVQDGQMTLRPLERHTDPIRSIAFSPDCMRMVSGSVNTTICVWDVQNGEIILGPFTGHTDMVSSVAFSPDGRGIVSGSEDGTVCVWDAEDGEIMLGPLEGHTNRVRSVAFSPDGMRIVSGSFLNTICVWDASAQGELTEEPLTGHLDWVRSAAFSPDGMYIVSASDDNAMYVWDTRNGEMALGPLEGHLKTVKSVAFSPDSTRIVSGSYDKTICVWSAQDGQMILGPLEGHTEPVNSVAFSPNGKSIVSGSDDKTICVWDAQKGQVMLGPLQGHTDGVNSVAFSPNGLRIVSSSDDGSIYVWGAQDGQMILHLPHHGGRCSVAFSPDSTRIVADEYEAVCVWDAQDGKIVLGPLEEHNGAVNSVAFSPDGTRIVSGSSDKTICVWDAYSGKMVMGPLIGHTGLIYTTSFSSDGMRIVSCSQDKVIRVWRVQNYEPATDSVPTGAPSSSLVQAHPTLPTQSLLDNSSDGAAFEWSLDEDGWVLDEHDRPRLWVPPDLRSSLLLPINTLLISARGHVTLNFENANIGELWTECYSPA